MEYKQYVARRRARFKGCNGQEVNIPYGSVLETQGGFLLWEGKPLCVDSSQNAYAYFSQNDDGQGRRRGELVAAILAKLEKQDAAHQTRWDKIWSDPMCRKYKRPEHEDYWIWNFDFYNAPIPDLHHIAALIGAKT